MEIINLSQKTKDYIDTITQQMEKLGVLEEADKKNIELLASQYELYVRAIEDLDKNGFTTVDKLNRTVTNPAFAIQRSAMTNIISLMKELSLSARQRRLLTSAGQTEEEDPMDLFLNKVNNED